jgi:hypothetical protein
MSLKLSSRFSRFFVRPVGPVPFFLFAMIGLLGGGGGGWSERTGRSFSARFAPI